MRILFIIGVTLAIAMLVACIVIDARTDKPIKKYCIRLLAFGIVPLFMQLVYALHISDSVSFSALGLYYATVDLVLLALLDFVEAYGEKHVSTAAVKLPIHIAVLADIVSMVLNAFFKHCFTLHMTPDYARDAWSIERSTPFFYFHVILSFTLVVFAVIYLLERTVNTPSFYRRRYKYVLIVVVSISIVNGLSIVTGRMLDFSVIFYCVIGILISYYSIFYKPTMLISRALSLIVKNTNDAILCFDIWSRCVYSNKKAQDYFGGQLDKSGVVAGFADWYRDNADRLGDMETYFKSLDTDSGVRPFRVMFHKLYEKNAYVGCFLAMYDRTEELARFKRESYRLTHDKLTGVYNREYFFEAVEKLLAENKDTKFYMICSNIKGFKLFNDLFGEEIGNQVLIMEAELLKRDAGEKNVYGRISGDEFAIVVPVDHFKEEYFTRNIAQMKEHYSNELYQMHLYVGVYEIDDINEPVSGMCDKAKLAIESNRGDYNAVVVYYDKNLLERSLTERKLLGEFDRAIEDEEFVMYLQPQIDTNDRLLGAEALVRWQHPERGLVFPGAFIGVLEETGPIYKLDKYMWEQAARKLREWKDMGRNDLYISVNISAKDFYYVDIFPVLTELVERYQINPRNLKLEITETVLMTQTNGQTETLDRLRAYGFQVEIDDFGSGYSSLNMLKDIDVDVVKIDMGFLRKEGDSERARAILDCIIRLIKTLAMEVVTEGVETKEQRDMLAKMGTDVFQGYYFEKPIPVRDFEEKYFM